jgi:DNA-binding transcriptional LysR family regulator
MMAEDFSLASYDTSISTLSFEQLQTFQAIVEAGTFTRAAESLFLTQSAVSQRIKRLEGTLGVELFDRQHNGRELRLTGAGERVLRFAGTMLRQMEELRSALQEHQAPGVEEPITIVTTAPIARALVPLLEAFRDRFPRVRVTVTHSDSGAINDTVASGRAEIGTQFAEWATGRFHKVTILRDQVVLVARANHPILAGQGLPASHLVHTYFVLAARGTFFRHLADEWAASVGLVIEGALESYSYDLMREAVLHRLGIAIMPQWMVQEELRTGLLRIVPVPGMPREFEVCLIADASRPLSAAARAVLQVAREGRWQLDAVHQAGANAVVASN